MRKIINPKTNKPYSQAELQEAYENGKSLPFVLSNLPNIGNIMGTHFVSKIWVKENGLSKEQYI